MRVICHIGHHKTGTTSLQAFLSQNFAPLLRSGILYPSTESEGAALALSAMASRGGKPPALLPINFREAHNALAFRMLAEALPGWKVPPYHRSLPHSRQMLLSIKHQAATIGPDWMILCAEVMSHFGKIAPDLIPRLQSEALAQATKVHLWCTLRRPDEQLVSWHGQQVRFGQSPAPLSDLEKGLNLTNLHVDYRGVIEPWLQQIDSAIPILRPYRETLAQGGSVDDFILQSGIPAPGGLSRPPSLNVSRKPALITLMRHANSELPRPMALDLSEWLDQNTANLTLASTNEVEFFGPAARARLCQHFTPIHRWLSATTGRAAFFTDIDQMAECRPIPESAALRQLLDQLTPHRLNRIKTPEIRDFLTRQRNAA